MTRATHELQILGIDAAVAPENTGIALARRHGDACKIHTVQTGARKRPVIDEILALLEPDAPLLIAVDAPLGWPKPLSTALGCHRAGRPLAADTKTAFSRETDRFVREHVGIKPMDIGAERIARTAAAALTLVDEIGKRTGQPLPLLAGPQDARTGGLIEVYPAATLKRHDLPHRQYKRPEATAVRTQIGQALEPLLGLGRALHACIRSDHCLDAAVCVLAATDFLAGNCQPPPEDGQWQKEGWIWFAR